MFYDQGTAWYDKNPFIPIFVAILVFGLTIWLGAKIFKNSEEKGVAGVIVFLAMLLAFLSGVLTLFVY